MQHNNSNNNDAEWNQYVPRPEVAKIFGGGEIMSITVEVLLVDGSTTKAYTWQCDGDIQVAWITDSDEPDDITENVLKWRMCQQTEAA